MVAPPIPVLNTSVEFHSEASPEGAGSEPRARTGRSRVAAVTRPSAPRRAALGALSAGVVALMVGVFLFGLSSPGASATSFGVTETTESTSTSSSSSSSSSTSTTTTTAPAPTTTQPPETTTTQRANTSTTQRATTSSSSSSSSTSSTSSSTTTIATAVVPPGYNDPNAPGSAFWTSGRKLFAVVFALLAGAIAMSVLTYFYWRATRPSSSGGRGDDVGGSGGGIPDTTGPVGPVSPMLADALRPDPFVTRDDLGLL